MTIPTFKLDRAARWDKRLAISPEWFGVLRAAFTARIDKFGGDASLNRHAAALVEGSEKYRPGGSGDLAKRLRWDVFWGVRSGLSEEDRADLTFSQNLTDAQLDSVLRRLIIQA